MNPLIRKELELTGLPWVIRAGAKHNHIVLDGSLVGVVPKGTKSTETRAVMNIRAQIRRYVKGRKEAE